MPNLDDLDDLDQDPLRYRAAPWGDDPHGTAMAPSPTSSSPVDLPPPTLTDTWRALAKCRGYPPDWWYPEGGPTSANLATLGSALAICRQCPVDVECLTHAVTWPESLGAWGGYSPKPIQRFRAATAAAGGWRIGEPGGPRGAGSAEGTAA